MARDLLWGPPHRGARGPRPAMTLSQIGAAAVELADAEGLAAVTIKSLAERLGTKAMTLYRYFPDKDELVALMLDTAIGEPPVMDPATPWREALRRWCFEDLAVFDRHPWALPVIAMPRRMGPNELAWGERAMVHIRRAGVPPARRFAVVMLLTSYVRGAAPLSMLPGHGPSLDIEAMTRAGALERYPLLMEISAIAENTTATPPGGPARPTFGDGLELLLDGIAGTRTGA